VDTCVAANCQNNAAPDDTPCVDADLCNGEESCQGGVCTAGTTLDCDDSDVCTTDSCDASEGCQHEDIIPCTGDFDGDGVDDGADECTTLDWNDPPFTPPSSATDQNPARSTIILKDLNVPSSTDIISKGFFNPVDDPNTPVIQPHVDGVHVRLENAGAVLLDVSIPGDAGVPGGEYAKGSRVCGDRSDGWKFLDRSSTGGVKVWKYLNRSGLIPAPGDTLGSCTGDAKGIVLILVKYVPARGSYQYMVKTKDHPLENTCETPPLTGMKFDLALGAQPIPGTASRQAIAGQCAESVFSAPPVGPAKPLCKRAPSTGPLKKIICKGL
jgi:hypothetical protein